MGAGSVATGPGKPATADTVTVRPADAARSGAGGIAFSGASALELKNGA